MATYIIAGSADDAKLAEALRLGDTLAEYLPTVTITQMIRVPADWPELAAKLGESLGVSEVESPIVFTPSGRVIGGVLAFSVYIFRKYGVACSFDKSKVHNWAEANHAEAIRVKDAMVVAGKQTGKRALLVIDVQNDFCRGGSLAVPRGNEVIPVINGLLRRSAWDLVVFSQDFHPSDHVSFSSNNAGTEPFQEITLPDIGKQMMWPDHCVQGSLGCEFHPYLDRASAPDGGVIVQKGKNKTVDSYSAFGDAKDHTLEKTELEDVLKAADIKDVYVVGLALDYCVAFTALDAIKAGFNTFLIKDASRGITPDGCDKAVADMKTAGAHIISSDVVPEHPGAPKDDSIPLVTFSHAS